MFPAFLQSPDSHDFSLKKVYLRVPNTSVHYENMWGRSILFNVTSYILRNDPRDATLGQDWGYYLKI